MKNKHVGYIILIIGSILGYLIYSFSNTVKNIAITSCTHGPSCPMMAAIDFQTNIASIFMMFIYLIGFYIIFFLKDKNNLKKQIEPKIPTKENYIKILEKLNIDERNILIIIIENQGSIMQSEIVEKSNFSKVKITRILDRLEGKKLIERKRRGMSNIVLLNHNNN